MLKTRLSALILGLAVAAIAVLLVPASAHASTSAERETGGISAWWWMLLLLLPLLGMILAWLRGRHSYDYTTFKAATGPGFPPVTADRAARLSALAAGTESSAALAIARADAAAAAAAIPVRPGARVPSEGGAVPLPIGASRPLSTDAMRAPDGYPIKADVAAGLFYRPDHPSYATVRPDLWFATAPTATAGGFKPAD